MCNAIGRELSLTFESFHGFQDANAPRLRDIINQIGTLILSVPKDQYYNTETTYPLFSLQRGDFASYAMRLSDLSEALEKKIRVACMIQLMQKVFHACIQVVHQKYPKDATLFVKDRLCALTLFADCEQFRLVHEQLIQKTSQSGQTFFMLQTTIEDNISKLKGKNNYSIKAFVTPERSSMLEAIYEQHNFLIQKAPTSEEMEFYGLQQRLEGWAEGQPQRITCLHNILDCFQNKSPHLFVQDLDDPRGFLDEITHFSFLSEVHWSYCRGHLTTIPEELAQLINLTKLSMEENCLSSLPQEIINLTNLKVLSLEKNYFKIFPDCLFHLPQLHSLSLADNYLREIPQSVSRLTSLKNLDLDNNMLSSLPETLRYCSSLEALCLSGNHFDSLPPVFADLTSLDRLFMNQNMIGKTVASNRCLTDLRKLCIENVEFPSLSTLIKTIHLPPNITVLDLEDNGLTECPQEILDLPSLTWLSLNKNQLTSFPMLVSAPAMQTLWLADNHLSSFPDEAILKQYPSLIRLDLSGNQLAYLPEWLSTFPANLQIALHGNPLNQNEINLHQGPKMIFEPQVYFF